jgi:hypothetical protein
MRNEPLKVMLRAGGGSCFSFILEFQSLVLKAEFYLDKTIQIGAPGVFETTSWLAIMSVSNYATPLDNLTISVERPNQGECWTLGAYL